MQRYLIASLLLAMLAAVGSPARAASKARDARVLVIGFDGMDPVLLKHLMDAGKMPTFSKLARRGTFVPLATAMPPQSPVAWSNVISGADPGTHEIFDFIHRDPNPGGPLAIRLYQSISSIQPVKRAWYQKLLPETIDLGDCRLRLSGGTQHVCMRKGPQFWDGLVAAGIDATVYRIPANFPPPVKVKGHGELRCLCGMGTPDVLGTPGTFTTFSEALTRDRKTVSGGRLLRLVFENERATSVLEGPPSPTAIPDETGHVPELTVPVEIVRDRESGAALVRIGDQERVLKPGEWSDWVPVVFDTGCFGQKIHGIVRLHLKSLDPAVLYVSPINVDPWNPAFAISTPEDFAAEVAATTGVGGMYSTDIPEQSSGKALRAKVLTEDEFLAMVQRLLDERKRQYRAALADFSRTKRGFLFFYFGHTDQLAHIFWRDRDPGHPGRIEAQAKKYAHVIDDAYIDADGLVAEALKVLDDNDTLIVMSDHGFASFRRGFNVNTWLLENGYLSIRSADRRRRRDYSNIDFANTEAYAVGINGLYINLLGREKEGIVPPESKRELMKEIAEGLEAVRDENGAKVIDKVYIVEDFYPKADPQLAPDMLIGYARNYRGSWATALGGQPEKLIEDNHDRWSGDHCIAAHLVPGILVTNRKVTQPDPSLSDIAPTVLGCFGLEKMDGMIGKDLFR